MLNRVVVAGILLGLVALIVYCGKGTKIATDAAATTYLGLNDTVSYVGINTCKQCHSNIYNSFKETGMGKSFDLATPQKSAGNFHQPKKIYDRFTDLWYNPFWVGDTLKVIEYRLAGGDTVHKRVQKINYIIGSGHHTNSHIININGYLTQAPFTFYTQKGILDFPPGFENGFNSRFSRLIGLECMSCHNAYPGFVEGSENKFTNVPQGIDCERCHGPGGEHVRRKQAGELIDTSKYIDYSIVNPGKLSADLQFQICQRCHLQGNAVLQPNKNWYSFKPGQMLSEVMDVYLPRYEGDEEHFIMASHADRLKQSECFIVSAKNKADPKALRPYKNALTCVTCHNPHVSVKKLGNNYFNNVCGSCHTTSKNNLCTETPAKLKAESNNCVKCHMPVSGATDIPHVTVHDHYIRKPDLKKHEVDAIKKFVGLACINNPNPTKRSKAEAYLNQYEKFEYKAYYLDSAWFYLKSGGADMFNLQTRYYFLKQDYKGLIALAQSVGYQKLVSTILVNKSYDNADAWACYRIGEALANVGDNTNAYTFFKQTVQLAPFYSQFTNKLAGVSFDLGKLDEAKKLYQDLIVENPNYASAYVSLGFIAISEGDATKAEKLYTRALVLDPNNEQALLNMAGLYMFKNQPTKAISYVKQVLKINPNNAKAKQLLQAI